MQEKQRHAGTEPSCAKCGGTHEVKTRNCCGVNLCEAHAAVWRRLVSENGGQCVICGNPVRGAIGPRTGKRAVRRAEIFPKYSAPGGVERATLKPGARKQP